MNLDDISAEIKAKAKECKTPEEIIELAKKEGIELTAEELEGIAGGRFWCEQEYCETYCYDFGM